MTLFRSHIDLAHQWWGQLLQPGDLALDATCGNGHDTLFLAQAGCQVIACDLQEEALLKSKERVGKASNVVFHHTCHAELALTLEPSSVKLVVFNLGYLPGSGNKQFTTRTETTLLALERLLPKVASQGAVCITLYPGHPEGAREEAALLLWAAQLRSPWTATHHRWLHAPYAPSLLLLQNGANSYH